MNIDWKDALQALKDNGEVPVDNTPDPEPVQPARPRPFKGVLTVAIDRKGRKGKTATIIEGFTAGEEELQELARTIKQKLGAGGSTRDGEILIQGERRQEVVSLLQSLGYKAR